MIPLASELILEPSHLIQMEADVSSRSAEEACGFVGGEGNHGRLVIPITNMLHDAHRFRMDPQEELDAFQQIENRGWEILAIYHSHPHGIQCPSPTDYAELSFSGIIYLIWFKESHIWRCRGYLMISQAGAVEIPVIISTEM